LGEELVRKCLQQRANGYQQVVCPTEEKSGNFQKNQPVFLSILKFKGEVLQIIPVIVAR
jgi:hypothetical protein